MVPLLTVASGFQARVLAARLGSEGIVVSLRGAVDGPYPLGDVFVDVDADQASEARALLLADEVEAVFVDVADGSPVARSRSWAFAASVVVVLAAIAVLFASSLVRIASATSDDRQRSATVLR